MTCSKCGGEFTEEDRATYEGKPIIKVYANNLRTEEGRMGVSFDGFICENCNKVVTHGRVKG